MFGNICVRKKFRKALKDHQFQVFYQPIVNLTTSRLSGFEALVRWAHPEEGLLGPNRFIPDAEKTGMIIPLGGFVLRNACRQLVAWRQQIPSAQDLFVSVNVSSHQLGPELLENLDAILLETGLDPGSLKLELTESVFIEDPDSAARMLELLRARRIKIVLDDFGTGYSSLSYLHRFAVDGLKIDKSFVDWIGRDDRRSALVPSIAGLAFNLGIPVIAEGVETSQQAQALKLLECAEAQGYLYSRPVPAQEATFLVEKSVFA